MPQRRSAIRTLRTEWIARKAQSSQSIEDTASGPMEAGAVIGKSLSPSCRGRTVKQATALPVTAIGSLNGWQYFPAHSILSTKSFQTFSSQVPTAFLLGFAQKILGGHRPPLQLGCATVGALYERPRCIFCAKPFLLPPADLLNDCLSSGMQRVRRKGGMPAGFQRRRFLHAAYRNSRDQV